MTKKDLKTQIKEAEEAMKATIEWKEIQDAKKILETKCDNLENTKEWKTMQSLNWAKQIVDEIQKVYDPEEECKAACNLPIKEREMIEELDKEESNE